MVRERVESLWAILVYVQRHLARSPRMMVVVRVDASCRALVNVWLQTAAWRNADRMTTSRPPTGDLYYFKDGTSGGRAERAR